MNPYIRGCAWEGSDAVPYPRADPGDAARLPGDTWATAQLPVGVRLELTGDAPEIEIEYRTATDDLGYRGEGAGRAFEAWRDGRAVGSAPAALGAGRVRLAVGEGAGRVVVYLPEGMRPAVVDVRGVGGSIAPAPPQPRWLVYGDSIAEGWVASGPSGAWPAIAGRQLGLDVINCGYAGSARGEMASAEQLAGVPADVISVSHGTNCWTRTPHTAGMVGEGTAAFLAVLRQGHPGVPIVVVTPVIRPDAEGSPNRVGATLADIRASIASAARGAGDPLITVVDGFPLLDAALLADGVHPGDEGHRVLADAIGASVARAMSGRPR